MFLLVKGTNQYQLNQSSASSPGSRFKCLHLQRSQHMQGVSGCAPQLCVVLQRGWVPFSPPTSLHLQAELSANQTGTRWYRSLHQPAIIWFGRTLSVVSVVKPLLVFDSMHILKYLGLDL